MTAISRRGLLAGSALGVTSIALPTASAAASGDEETPAPTVAFAPAVDFERAGVAPNTTITVRMAWAEGYTRAAPFPQPLTGTTGALAAFTFVVEGTNTSDAPVSTSGSGDGSIVQINQSAKASSLVTVTLTSTQYPSDVREFTFTR